jgi:hypothetical protein
MLPPRVKLKTSKIKLRKLQSMACLIITEAMKTSSWRLKLQQVLGSTAVINENPNPKYK